QGGLLYDKFVNFVEDLQRIGTSLEQGQKAYDSALKRLSEGQGNLIRSAEKIKDLGAKASKNLPDSLMKD
ncbi:MAG: DNA recombination protein RmuC, partial [Leptospiraceae bacterium]|nr:DNA recombination protein RmuC [Leptospiraceae bacterium]